MTAKTNSASFFLFFAVFGIAAEAADPVPSLRALQKVQAALQVGVSYRDYMSLLRDVRFERNRLKEATSDGGYVLLRAVSEAMFQYETAGAVWEVELDLRDRSGVDIGSQLGKTLSRHCPKSSNTSHLSFEACRNEVWERADLHVQEAAAITKGAERLVPGSTPRH